MTFVVAEPCIKCKYTECAEVCPVDCFYEGENFVAINPYECIECSACVPECPVEAIFSDEDLPAKWSRYLALNAELAPRWPVITGKHAPLPDAERWRAVDNKGAELSYRPHSRGDGPSHLSDPD